MFIASVAEQLSHVFLYICIFFQFTSLLLKSNSVNSKTARLLNESVVNNVNIKIYSHRFIHNCIP